MQFAENVQANWQEEYCFDKTMPDPIHPEHLRREFKHCSGNFLNIHLTAQTWPLVTSVCLGANVSLMMKWLRQQSEDFCAAGFDALVKRWDKCISVGGGYVEK
jgi:hypothetical protein